MSSAPGPKLVYVLGRMRAGGLPRSKVRAMVGGPKGEYWGCEVNESWRIRSGYMKM